MTNKGNTNTVLLVLVLLLLVGFVVWRVSGSARDNNVDNGINVDVNLPTGEGANE